MLSAAKIISRLELEVAEAAPKTTAGRVYLSLVESFPLVKIESKKQNEIALKVMERLIIYMNENQAHIAKDVALQINQYMTCLGELISDFERVAYPAPKVNPAEMIAYLMEAHGLKQKDLSEELGGQSVVSAILRGQRELNTRQIRALANRFHVSPAVFI